MEPKFFLKLHFPLLSSIGELYNSVLARYSQEDHLYTVCTGISSYGDDVTLWIRYSAHHYHYTLKLLKNRRYAYSVQLAILKKSFHAFSLFSCLLVIALSTSARPTLKTCDVNFILVVSNFCLALRMKLVW